MVNEKRLIDRNEIFPNGTFFANAEDPLKSLDELIKRIWSIPTVDAVEVVRCKDCVNYCGFEHCKNGICDVDSVSKRAVYPNDFCSYGERRTDD